MFQLPVAKQIDIARRILPDLEDLGNGCVQATCPGADAHTTATGKRDFRIWFAEGQGPHDHCMHKSCAAARDAFMRALYAAIRKEDPAVRTAIDAKTKEWESYRHAPKERPEPVPLYNPRLAAAVADGCPIGVVDDDWLMAHSPTPIPQNPHEWPRLLLDSLYQRGDRILVFTKFASQGQLLHVVGGDTLRLEEHPPRPGYSLPPRAKSGFPAGGANGCWFLCAPVTGEWMPNEHNRDKFGAKLGRRHAAAATRFPYLVLESDEAPPAVWLRILVQLQDPIAAVYTSGGKSYHALVRVDCRTKEEFDVRRREFVTRLAELGADPAAITAVRLTRLPGCLRFGSGEGADHKPYLGPDGKPAPRMQRLLYLNPKATQGNPLCRHD